MTKQIVPMLVLAWGVVAFAHTPSTSPQAPPPSPQTPPPSQQPSKSAKSDTVTVTGCVAEGTGGRFMLNNAMMSHDMSKKEGTTTSPTTPPSSTGTYTLVGGENLKAHVGHKVEVTGSMSMGGSGTT